MSVFYVPLLFFIQSSFLTCVYTYIFSSGLWNHQLFHPCDLRFFAGPAVPKSRGSPGDGVSRPWLFRPWSSHGWLSHLWRRPGTLEMENNLPGNSAGDLYWKMKTWPFQRSSYLQLVDEKVTVLNHHLFQQNPNFKTSNLIWNWGIQDTHGQINAHIYPKRSNWLWTVDMQHAW